MRPISTKIYEERQMRDFERAERDRKIRRQRFLARNRDRTNRMLSGTGTAAQRFKQRYGK